MLCNVSKRPGNEPGVVPVEPEGDVGQVLKLDPVVKQVWCVLVRVQNEFRLQSSKNHNKKRLMLIFRERIFKKYRTSDIQYISTSHFRRTSTGNTFTKVFLFLSVAYP
jgi:hypothetical protein